MSRKKIYTDCERVVIEKQIQSDTPIDEYILQLSFRSPPEINSQGFTFT